MCRYLHTYIHWHISYRLTYRCRYTYTKQPGCKRHKNIAYRHIQGYVHTFFFSRILLRPNRLTCRCKYTYMKASGIWTAPKYHTYTHRGTFKHMHMSLQEHTNHICKYLFLGRRRRQNIVYTQRQVHLNTYIHAHIGTYKYFYRWMYLVCRQRKNFICTQKHYVYTRTLRIHKNRYI